jgi:DNA-binding transcriptional LysR family regulator
MKIYFSDEHRKWLTMKPLDLEAVEAFVLTADLKSFTRAAEAMATSQSAVSLRIKRLEQGLGRRLIERTPRMVRLSADGSAFLPAARNLLAAHRSAIGAFARKRHRLTVGLSPHLVGAELPGLLRHLAGAEPDLLVEMRIATSQEILDDFDRGRLDAAVVLRHERGRQDGETLFAEAFGWMGAPDFAPRAGEPLRLATQAEPCSVRSMALNALDAAGIAWTEVFVGGGTATIGAAVLAGLAIAALGRRVAPPGTVDLGQRLGLPPLPSRDVVLHAAADPKIRGALRTLVAAIRSTVA